MKNNIKLQGLFTLVVEDDKLSSFYIRKVVDYVSDQIITVENGFDAVKFCEKNKEIDLILMDIQLPRMDGYQATEKIRKFNKEVVIIAQTAHCSANEQRRAIEAGCNDYISKPYTKELLLNVIRKHFNFVV